MQGGSLERRGRFIAGGVMILILAFSLVLLQQQFDQGDNRRAMELLMSKPPGARWSIAEELNARSGAEHPTCAPHLVSSFAGTMDVTCTAGSAGEYVFHVDLVRKLVTPGDERASELLRTVSAKNAQPSGGGQSGADAGSPGR